MRLDFLHYDLLGFFIIGSVLSDVEIIQFLSFMKFNESLDSSDQLLLLASDYPDLFLKLQLLYSQLYSEDLSYEEE